MTFYRSGGPTTSKTGASAITANPTPQTIMRLSKFDADMSEFIELCQSSQDNETWRIHLRSATEAFVKRHGHNQPHRYMVNEGRFFGTVH
jgi:hypothetical protein